MQKRSLQCMLLDVCSSRKIIFFYSASEDQKCTPERIMHTHLYIGGTANEKYSELQTRRIQICMKLTHSRVEYFPQK